MLCTPTAGGLDVQFGHRGQVSLSWRWLRDHGDDETSRDPKTLQRRVDTFAIDPDAAGLVTVGDDRLTIEWTDGLVTTHGLRELEAVLAEYQATDWSVLPEYKPRLVDGITLWSEGSSDRADEIDLARFLDDDTTLAHGVDQLCRYGYLVLRGSELKADEGAGRILGRFDRSRAEAFAKRLGYVRHTIFGGMWDLAPNLDDHADTAYTSIYLGPHTDGTYSHDAPGLQFFLCLQAAVSGGESLLIDGFAIAAELAGAEPDVYVDLASIPVPGHYVEPGIHLRAERPVLRANARGVLDQVSFNNYDRAPFLLPPDLEQRFYRAYGRFAELANDPGRRVEITLTSGDIMIFDNWRTLHGRNAFRGFRHYVGGYLNHEELESKRRVLTRI
ncbi:MAG: TauD/TfdA family dioxygenase [Acidimicrobiia bacterium]|nr:TauD/TfdA family dioxygenase [Acidimicrobiia bacterium]